MSKYLAEFIGVFFWMLTLGCVALSPAPGTIPALALGGVVMIMTLLITGVSGAHLNPAVSLAMWRSGALTRKDLVPFVIFQFLGAAAAAAVVKLLKRGSGAGTSQLSYFQIFTAELLFTFLLCAVFLHLQRQTEKNSPAFTGAMLGSVVMVGNFAMGSVSGGVFNAAISLGAGMLGLISWKHLCIYVLAQLAAGWIAAEVFSRWKTGASQQK